MYSHLARSPIKARSALALATCLMAMITLTGVAKAESPPADCQNGELCAYAFTHYNRLIFHRSSSDQDWGNDNDGTGDPLGKADDNAWSIFNNSTKDVYVFSEPNFGGDRLCIPAGAGHTDLHSLSRDSGGEWGGSHGVISSHQFVRAGTCQPDE